MIKKIFNSNSKYLKQAEPYLKKIKEFEATAEKMSMDEIKARVGEMKQQLQKLVAEIPENQKISVRKVNRREGFPPNESAVQDMLLQFLPEFYSYMNQVYKRKLGFTYHDVQYKAGIILAHGQRLVEMKTGEGKTMTFQLPLALYSLAGRGSHLATVNDYLAKVGGEYAGHILSELGITVGIITPQNSYKYITNEEVKSLRPEDEQTDENKIQIDSMNGRNLNVVPKREAYKCDITFGTNNEFGFDYLRDNMARSLHDLSQRELYFCIIDEADSILIDEARTPLIISATPSDSDTEKYTKFAQAVKDLEEDVHYQIDHKRRSASLTEEGIKVVENNLGVTNIWDDFTLAYHMENALKAKAMFQKDQQYLIRGGEVLIVDEFTGRIMKGRRYSEGLHQAIEAKEGVEIKQESKTMATVTFQNFFRMYKVLVGGSGTVVTEAEEFYKIYGLDTIEIPTNRPNIRKDHSDRIFKTEIAKFNAVVKDITEQNKKGRPVLVGTVSVEKSELLSKLLDEAGIDHEVLNAKFHEQESRIITKAGKKGSVTVATNMAGRGTDIVVGGGSRGDAEWKEVIELGGLYVIGTERHDSRRIDNQLRGRTGRQGEPGETRFYVSLEDQLMRVLGGEVLQRLLNFGGVQDDYPIEIKLISKQIESAQKRIEGMNFDSRKSVVEYDDVMNSHREIFYSRRKNLISSLEKSQGRFLENRDIIDINLQEYADRKAEFNDAIEEAKQNVTDLVQKKVSAQVEHLVNLNLSSRTDDKAVDEFIKDLEIIFPKEVLAKSMQISENQVSEKIKSEVKDKKTDELLVWVKNISEKIFEVRLKEFGVDFLPLARSIILQEMDNKWVEHLEIMKDIREGIGLQGYAQKNPLVEYQNKAFEIFESFIWSIDIEIVKVFMHVKKVKKEQITAQQKLMTNEDQVSDILTGDREMLSTQTSIKDVIKHSEKSERMQKASLKTNSASTSKTIQKQKTFGRNDKVNVKYTDGKILKDVKYKKVESDLLSGKASLI